MFGLLLVAVGLSSGASTVVTYRLPGDAGPTERNFVLGSDRRLVVGPGGFTGFDLQAGEPSGGSARVSVDLQGGTIRSGFSANAGSRVHVTSGRISGDWEARDGASVRFEGGVGDRLTLFDGASLVSTGGRFQSVRAVSAAVEHRAGWLFPLDLLAGSRGRFVGDAGNQGGGRLIEVNRSDAWFDGGYRLASVELVGGATLRVEGGALGTVWSKRSVVGDPPNQMVFTGGEVDRFEVVHAQARIEAGRHNAGRASEIAGNGLLELFGGTIEPGLRVGSGGTLIQYGGEVRAAAVHGNGRWVWRGGRIAEGAQIAGGSLEILGDRFEVNGELIEDLAIGQSLTLLRADALIAGRLADQTPFEQRFSPNRLTDETIGMGGTLILTRVPEPGIGGWVLVGLACFARRRRGWVPASCRLRPA